MKQLGGNPDWWRGAVIYQIYPRSFQDSNGDGIGDLAGIVSRLDHVADLGVDAIWLSPFFTSPMKDFGYDVSDYCDVDPMFGTLADFDALIDAAHARGLRVMIDLVLSHTSDQHPWFVESRSDATNSKADWYVWRDAKSDGTPPNNWLSIFGGSGWQWDGRRMQYYQHNFLDSQPDLNFHNEEVQNALLDVTRFWLDRGVDGFRLDTINFYFCDKDVRDNPALPVEARNATIAPSVNPYNWQDHLYDKNRPENLDFLKRFRSVLNEYSATAAVGEVGDGQRGLQIMGQYTAGDERMHMCYSFELLSLTSLNGTQIAQFITDFQREAGDGWPTWAMSNHDVERHGTRLGTDEAGLKQALTLMLCLRGSVCLYQGEELGFGEAEVAFEDLQDPYGIEFWPEFKGRDGCRTPMVWESNADQGGFTTGKPWLPVSEAHKRRAANAGGGDADSMLAHYRSALRLRHDHPVLIHGDIEVVEATDDHLVLLRRNESELMLCAFNFGASPLDITLPSGRWMDMKRANLDGSGTIVPPHSSLLATRE